MTVDTEKMKALALAKDLRFLGIFAKETEEQVRIRRYNERHDAANFIESLIAEVERLRAERESSDALLSACRKGVVALAHAADNPMYMEAYEELSSAIEAEVSARCRAEGGSTSENMVTSKSAESGTKLAETRMNTSFEGDVKCAAPAAGTAQDAELDPEVEMRAMLDADHRFEGAIYEIGQAGYWIALQGWLTARRAGIVAHTTAGTEPA